MRTTNIDGMDIEEGDIMAIGDQGMLAVEKSVNAAALKALEEMQDKDSELVTIYYGAEVDEASANRLFDQAQEKFPELEIELQNGGQPVYYYMISVE